MANVRRVAVQSVLWKRGLPLVLASLLTFAACGDDTSTKTREGGDAGAGNAGESSSAGGSSAASANAGDAGAGPTGTAGSGEGGLTGSAGGNDGGAGPGAGMSLDDFCDLVTVRAPQWLRDCRNLANSGDWWGSLNVEQFCSSGRDAIEAGRLQYDPVQAEACAAMSVGDCGHVDALAWGTRPQQLVSDACAGVVTGTVALNDECHPDSTSYADECAEGYCAPTACPSVCTPFAEEDDDCDGRATLCDPTALFCNAQSKCQPFVAPGQPCPGRDECAPGDVCHGLDDQTYLCTTPVALGQPCDEVADVCADDGICFEGECTAKVALGETCHSTNHCPAGSFCNETCIPYVELDGDCTFDICGPGLTCVLAVCLAQGTAGDDCPCELGFWCDESNECQAPGAVGDTCSTTVASSCPVPLFCHPQTLKCTEPAAQGESCSMRAVTDSCQSNLHCVCTANCASPDAQGTCEARLANGQECALWHDCSSGTCAQLECAPSPLCF